MQNKFLLLSLVCVWAEAESRPAYEIPVPVEADLANLSYEVEEEDLDNIGKILDEPEPTTKKTVKENGFKKQKTATKGLKGKHNRKDFRKLYKLQGGHDQDSYDDDDSYGEAEGVIGQAVSVTGNEDRKYRNGTKSRGFHRVYHKDEYKKDKVIYEDDETSGKIKKVGAKGFGYKVDAGSGSGKGHHHHDRTKAEFGKRGYVDKGDSNNEREAFNNAQGFDQTFPVNDELN